MKNMESSLPPANKKQKTLNEIYTRLKSFLVEESFLSNLKHCISILLILTVLSLIVSVAVLALTPPIADFRLIKWLIGNLKIVFLNMWPIFFCMAFFFALNQPNWCRIQHYGSSVFYSCRSESL